MPSKMLHSLAMKAGVSMGDAEHKWNKAKKIASKRYKEESKAYWPVVVGITKRMLGLNEDIASPADGAPMQVLLGTLLYARNCAQVLHWQTRSFAAHLALGELYAAIDDKVDELAEAYMGTWTGTELNGLGVLGQLDTSSPLAFAKALQQMLAVDFAPAIPQVGHLVNTFQELEGAVAKVCYKLEHLS